MDRDSSVQAAADQRPETDDTTPGVPTETELSPRPSPERGTMRAWAHHMPFLQLLVYYLLLIGLVLLLTNLFPVLRRAFFMPIDLPAVSGEQALLTGTEPVQRPVVTDSTVVAQAVDRALTTLLVTVGALLLVLPVAWVYMRTKRLRYDPALVHSVIILPIVVAGIALVVKNSIALAFSLAGIVAAVRFRNTLKDPRDAVYIFLTIGIGLSAGVQALDVALVMSMIFNFIVLFVWRFNIGSIYGGSYGRTGVISAGSPSLLLAQDPDRRKEIRLALLDEAEEMDIDGVLLVHTADPELARGAVQETMNGLAKEWRLARILPRGRRFSTLEYVVRLKKKTSPTDLVGALKEHWSHQVAAVEYFSVLMRERERDENAESE
jgi:hypothetical protein